MKAKELPGSLLHSFKLRYMFDTSTVEKRDSVPVVISLTSIEHRLSTLDIVIKSLIRQSVRPEKIILWLNNSLQKKIPKRLSRLQDDLFQIRYVPIESSHKKLVYTIDAEPDKAVVVCDDDFIYPVDWIELLHRDSLKYPGSIIANAVRKISYDDGGVILPYRQWRHESDLDVTAACYMGVGYGGVLYPPNCFYRDVLNQALFLKLTPRADDLWFKMMSHLNGTPTRRVSVLSASPIPIAGTQFVSLKSGNVKKDHNRDQWQALSEYYNFTGF